MEKLFVLDAINFLFRSFYAIRGMKNKEGIATNALYGFVRSVQKILKEHNPSHCVAVFDGPNNKKSRTDIYAEYKANREGMPQELVPQLQYAMDFCKMAGIPMLCIDGVEADDVIGSIAHWSKEFCKQTFLLSSDKDLAQLVDDNVFLLHVHKDNLLVDKTKVKEIYGVYPKQIIDYLAIVGDTSDNIPGISGMGPKTASKLLDEYQSLSNLFLNLDRISNLKQREKLINEKDKALMSKQLATIQLHVDIPKDSSFYALKEHDHQLLSDFYQKMNFSSLLKEMEAPQTIEKEVVSYKCIETIDDLSLLTKELEKHKEICIDTETTSLDQMQAKLVGIGFCVEEKKAFYVPLNSQLDRKTVLEFIRPICKNQKNLLIGHNLKYDLHILINEGIEVTAPIFDTMVASYLLHPDVNRHGLDHLCSDIFGKTKLSYKELTLVGKKQVGIDEIPIEKACHYCCEDVDYTLRLKNYFQSRLEEENLQNLFYEVEMPLLNVLLAMEKSGIFVDLDYFKELSKDFNEQIAKLKSSIFEIAGETFNLNSPKQLSAVLFEKLELPYPRKKKKTGFSTSIDILEALANEYTIVKEIIAYRSFEKLRSTYIDSLPSQVNPNTKRIHPSFNQSVTATGRLSCTNPNLQNIPIRTTDGRKIRTGFKPQKSNHSFLSADYSQIELRILAHLSKDPALTEAFITNQDIHRHTASLIFNVPPSDVDQTMRYHAKAVNFGIVYGQQAFGLAKEIHTDVRSAAKFIETYFARYPKVKEYIDLTIADAYEHGFAKTLLGRKRPLSDLKSSNKMIRMAAERYAINTPIQGTQADIIKLAMCRIHELLTTKSYKSFLILQIHDELIFECPDDELPFVQELVKETMENIYPMVVPLKVDIHIGKNWGEC